jgi:putative ABC transport system substrate-binding protein
MRRRDFMKLLGGAAAWPIAAGAQQSQKQHRIAFVHSGIPADHLTETTGPFWVRRFYETLRGLGETEGSNLVVERYSAEGRADRFAALAAEVVGRKPDVIVSNLNDLVKAFTTATTTIPIVAIIADPIALGLVRSLARPGGNLTGVSIDTGTGIVAKRLQILKEAMPSAIKVAYLLSNSGTWDSSAGLPDREAAQQLGIALTGNFLAEVNEVQLRRTIVELAQKHRIPVIYPYRDYADLGGLMAYAPELGELAQRMANDVHQILNGAKPGDIPFYQPNKFQLIVNLKAAKALDLIIPQSLITSADEVIE